MVKVNRLDRLVGAATLFLFPITTLGVGGLSMGMVLTLALGPVLVAALPRFQHALPISLLWLGCVVCAPLLTELTVSESIGRTQDTTLMLQVMLSLAVGLLAFGLLLWGRWKFGARYTLAVFAAGTLAQALAIPASWADNPWKYALAWPVAVLLLTVRRSNGLVLLVLLGVTSVLLDFRSFAAVSMLAVALVAWRRKPNAGRARTLRPLLVVGVLTFVGVQVGTWMALQGHLGYSIQARTFDQTQGGEQSALLGARPEWAATWALAAESPIGYGPGTVPALDDVTTARSGLYSVGADTSGEYVDDYLFGGRIELHSVAADLWSNFGPLGVALAVALGGWIVAALGRSLAAGAVSGWWVFLALLALWDLLFSPLGSNLLHVVAAAAMALPLRQETSQPEPEPKLAALATQLVRV